MMKAVRLASALSVLALSLPLALLPPPTTVHALAAPRNPFCARLGQTLAASSGAWMYCFGPQARGPSTATPPTLAPLSGPNVDAASLAEDISPAGVRAYGQSETSIAGSSPYVVEAWNDATGFFAPCPSPQSKEELTGFGFSADGGASFTDLGGLPNGTCAAAVYEGDPSVETWHSGGATYFYISSLFNGPGSPDSYLAMTACTASGTGPAASLGCSQPIIMAQSSECSGPVTATVCSFLDKDFLALDPARGRLYITYTDFSSNPASPLFQGQVQLAVCDLGTAAGRPGPRGGTAAAPVCTQPSPTGQLTRRPYYIVAPGTTCENEGAYPAVDEATGDVYVAWEYNWATNLGQPFGPPACQSQPTQNKVARVPFACLTLTAVSPCGTPPATVATSVISLDGAFIPGYNRVPASGNAPASDFPRLAVSDPARTVSIVWNDARRDPNGDILLQSYTLGSLAPVQAVPVRLNGGPDDRAVALHFLPALRQADAAGRLTVSWFDRRRAPSTAYTDVFAAVGVDPRTTSTPVSNVRVTTVASNWLVDSSDIVPNFGDYTDSYVNAVPVVPYRSKPIFVAWSDGRLGEPQPFAASLGAP